MIHAARDPAAILGDAQHAPWIARVAERARDGHEAIAQQAAGTLPAPRDGETAHAGWQRHGGRRWQHRGGGIAAEPVLVEQVSVAEIGRTRAPHVAQERQGGGVRAHLEGHVRPVHAAGERRAEVWRPEEDQMAEALQPGAPAALRVPASAARHQASHAVRDERQPVEGRRPRSHQRVEEVGERAAVRGDVETAVVVEVRHRAVEIALQRRAVIVPVAAPAQVRHAEPVHQDHGVPPRVRKRFCERARCEVEQAPVAPEGHGDGERVVRGDEVVAHDAVQRRPDGHRSRGEPVGRRRIGELLHDGVERGRQRSTRTADAPVDEPRHSPGRLEAGAPQHERCPRDLVVHALHHVGQRLGRLERELPPSAETGDADGTGPRHHVGEDRTSSLRRRWAPQRGPKPLPTAGSRGDARPSNGPCRRAPARPPWRRSVRPAERGRTVIAWATA